MEVAPAIVHRSFAIAAMPEGSQKFASESIFNFNFIFKLKFEFRLWEHLGNSSHFCELLLTYFSKKSEAVLERFLKEK